MGLFEPVVVTQVQVGAGSPLGTFYGSVGTTGYGNVDSGLDNEKQVFTNLKDIQDNYGSDSAIYGSALLQFLTGGQKIFVVQASSSAGVGDSFQVGDAATKKFTVVGVVDQILKGSLVVEINSVQKTEGTDYIVDYSNGDVYFKTPPPNGSPDGDLDFVWRESTPAQIATALDELLFDRIEFIGLAYLFKNSYCDELLTHITEAKSDNKLREAVYAGQYLDATTIKTTATTNDSSRMSLWANRSGYGGNQAASVDSSLTWLEFTDPASAVLGVISARKPWKSLHRRNVRGINYYKQWTRTEVGDEATPDSLIGKNINIFVRNVINAIVINEGTTNDQSRQVRWLDDQRTIDLADDRLKTKLSSSNVVGESDILLEDILAIDRLAYSVLMDLYRVKAIANPNDTFPVHGVQAIDFELKKVLLTPAVDRTPAQNQYLIDRTGDRTAPMAVFIDHRGQVHRILIDLGQF